MNAMQHAVTKALRVPSRMERIFNLLKDSPKITAATVGGKLNMKLSASSSLLSQMESRGMVRAEDVSIRVRSGKGFSTMPVKHYSVAIAKYELLPVPKAPTKPAKKFANVATHLPPAPLPPHVARLQDLNVVVTGSTRVEDLVERLSIRDARAVYESLHKLFGPKA